MTDLEPTDGDALTDADLVPLAAAGDMASFARLYCEYGPHAYAVARRTLDPDAAEDASHLVFLWLLEGRWRITPHVVSANGRLHAFVKTTAKYAAWKRGYQPIVLRHATSFEDDRYEIRHAPPTPLQILLRKERLTQLRAAFRSLPPHLRQTALLRYGHGLSTEDIAAHLTAPGLRKRAARPGHRSPTYGPRTVSAVYKYLGRIRAHLRHQLKDVYDLPPDCAGRHMRADT